MKKNHLFHVLIGTTVLLTSAGLFTACSSDDETVDNPNYNAKENTVKTQFTLSLPDNAGKTTRMTGDIVQVDDESATVTFRGMDNIFLVPYSLGSGNVLETSTPNAQPIKLANFDAFDNANSNAKFYADVNLNVGTTNFLVYGKAKDATLGEAITTAADRFKYGTLSVTGLAENTDVALSSVEFSPVSIEESKTDVGTAIIAALNAVADAAPTEDNTDGVKPKFKEVTEDQSADINHIFTQFKSLTTASSFSVEQLFADMYDSLETLLSDNTSDNYKLATAIRAAIDAQRATTGQPALKSDLTGYPSELPNGAVRVAWDNTNMKFVAATEMAYATNMNVATLDKYVYPANLYYWVNSPLKVSSSKQSLNYGVKAWNSGSDDVLSLYTDGTTIGVNTQSVAITNQLQYGVARLNATINALTDGNYYDREGKVVNVTNGYTLTGILIGGQKKVGWNFAPKGTDEYTIYDKTLASGVNWTVKNGTPTSTNYTLALETEKDKSIYVALELVNNGSKFMGASGLIPAGGKFYLVAELKPSAGTGYADVTTGKDRVFTQDFKTIANFTIAQGTTGGVGGLATATNYLPDLRVSQKELGLSVNLSWQAGLTFDVTI